MKRALVTALGLLALCSPLFAQDTRSVSRAQLEQTGEIDTSSAVSLYQLDVFSTVEGSILIHSLPVTTLLDGRRFLVSELGRMGYSAVDILPAAFLRAVEYQNVTTAPMYATGRPGGVVNLRLNRDYSGGEAGVFYGKSGGKYGREDFQTYIIGGVGNDKFHVTAGAAYQESSGRGLRYGR